MLDVWKDPYVYLQERPASQMHIQHYKTLLGLILT